VTRRLLTSSRCPRTSWCCGRCWPSPSPWLRTGASRRGTASPVRWRVG